MYRSDGRLVAALGAVVVLSACQIGPFKGRAAPDAVVTTTVPGNSAAGAPTSGEHDVEAPKTFSITAKALWDGRPSLGGVWIAHTSVKDPQRVMIRDPATGKSVVGALFRREIDNPGPPLQLSSEAAEALGLLAGQPVTLSVVALERVEAPAAPVEPIAPMASAKTDLLAKTKGGDKTVTKTDKLTTAAAAAIDKATTKTAAQPEPVMVKPAAKPAAAPATTDSQILKRPFVQLGIFSVEANAKKAAAQMQKVGLKASVHQDQSQGKTFWRVLIGPATSVVDRDAMAAKVKSLGYPDSYPVSK